MNPFGFEDSHSKEIHPRFTSLPTANAFLEDSPEEKLEFPSLSQPNEYSLQNFLENDFAFESDTLDSSLFRELTFNLESDARNLLSNPNIFSESEKKLFWNLIAFKVKKMPEPDRISSIKNYKDKKSKRKMAYKIRYKVRQDLAIKRLRNKGKFIKSKKMDIRTAANIILSEAGLHSNLVSQKNIVSG